jgi:hypothetical protein
MTYSPMAGFNLDPLSDGLALRIVELADGRDPPPVARVPRTVLGAA